MERQPLLFAVSGVKNSGKTTLIGKLLPILSGYGLKVAVIKHDGHDFQADVPGTDSHAHLEAGAYGTAVFSSRRFLAVKNEAVTERELAVWFPEADLILLEGFKYSDYPKIEVVRAGNANGGGEPVCSKGVVALAADGPLKGRAPEGVPLLDLNCPEEIAEFLLDYWFAASQLSLVVLAGGKSRRMGRDKADLPYRGRTFLQRRVEIGRALGIRDVVVSGYQGADCAYRVVQDRLPGRGPLGGMEAALSAADGAFSLVITVDVPLVDEGVLRELIRAFRRFWMEGEHPPVLLLRHGERVEPLLGIYTSGLSPQIAEILEQGGGAVFSLLDRCGYRMFDSSAPEERFFNVNDPKAYEKLQDHRLTRPV